MNIYLFFVNCIRMSWILDMPCRAVEPIACTLIWYLNGQILWSASASLCACVCTCVCSTNQKISFTVHSIMTRHFWAILTFSCDFSMFPQFMLVVAIVKVPIKSYQWISYVSVLKFKFSLNKGIDLITYYVRFWLCTSGINVVFFFLCLLSIEWHIQLDRVLMLYKFTSCVQIWIRMNISTINRSSHS